MRCSVGLPPSSAASTGKSSICSVPRCGTPDGCQAAIQRRIRMATLQNESARNSPALPAPLLRPTPRNVRLNASGVIVVAVAVLLLAGGGVAEVHLYRRAKISESRMVRFESERVVTGAQVTRVQRRNGENGRRITMTYQYAVNGREYTGSTTVRTSEHDPFSVGSPVAVWYLPSEPDASWMDGDAPRVQPTWPALVLFAACGFTAVWLMLVVRRQSNLLTYGRPAWATIREVEKKKSDKGAYWRVHYEWTLLSGATRKGRYSQGKNPPVVGTTIPILYDRDEPSRNSRYPLSLVRVV